MVQWLAVIVVLQDLIQVSSGALAVKLLKWIEIGASHVYECTLCSQKGFCNLLRICKIPRKLSTLSETDSYCPCEYKFNIYGFTNTYLNTCIHFSESLHIKCVGAIHSP